MTSWINVFKAVPADAATVWIVRWPFCDKPIHAVYSVALDGFVWTDSAANAHTISINFVAKWRPL